MKFAKYGRLCFVGAQCDFDLASSRCRHRWSHPASEQMGFEETSLVGRRRTGRNRRWTNRSREHAGKYCVRTILDNYRRAYRHNRNGLTVIGPQFEFAFAGIRDHDISDNNIVDDDAE